MSGDPFALSAEIMITPASRTGCMRFQFGVVDPDGREAAGLPLNESLRRFGL
jgi:hypothetical protein